jgi:hypothetical protein
MDAARRRPAPPGRWDIAATVARSSGYAGTRYLELESGDAMQ